MLINNVHFVDIFAYTKKENKKQQIFYIPEISFSVFTSWLKFLNMLRVGKIYHPTTFSYIILTIFGPTNALVGYLVVECVGPEGRVRDGGGDGAVVHEPELSHHQELPVPAHAQERDSNPTDILHINTAESEEVKKYVLFVMYDQRERDSGRAGGKCLALNSSNLNP